MIFENQIKILSEYPKLPPPFLPTGSSVQRHPNFWAVFPRGKPYSAFTI